METCSILIPDFEIYFQGDEHGCLNKSAHLDEHITIFPNGKIIQWEFEFCLGCTECDPEESECFISKEITKDQVVKILTESYKGNLPEKVSSILSRLK
jgi:hypothetical protein